MRTRRSLPAMLFLVLWTSLSHAAQNYYMKIEGTKQVAFKGQVSRKGGAWIRLLSYSQSMQSPRDVATGQASGKRLHKPVVVRKEVDGSSQEILRAVQTNEVLKDVVIELVRTDPRGQEEVVGTITLKNAHIDNVRKIATPVSAGRGRAEEEEISFSYQEVQVTDKAGKITATDNWNVPK